MFRRNLFCLVCTVSIIESGAVKQTRVEKASLSIRDQTGWYDKTLEIDNAEPLILRVDTSGNARYRSIQAAIDAAQPGSVVRVGPGIYRENLVIDKPLKIEGSGWENTVVTPSEVLLDSLEELSKRFETILRKAKTDEEKQQAYAKLQELQEDMKQFSKPTLLVKDAQNVDINRLKFTLIPADGEGRSLAQAVVEFQNAIGTMVACVVIGSLEDGIHIGDGSKVTVRSCLVAGTMGTGIVVSCNRNNKAEAVISACDVRNCRYRGIVIWYKCDPTVVENCRISGSAWQGIRYGGAPLIIGNLIFNNEGGAIYASGNEAVVRHNLFYKNRGGISCHKNYSCIIEQNTFAYNGGTSVFIHEGARPLIRRNIFFGNEKALSIKEYVDQEDDETSQAVVFADNVFWKNDEVGIDLPEGSQSKEFDPLFKDAEGDDFSLAVDSDAHKAGIGAAGLISFKSPWPVQPEELAIIPKIDSRAYNLWQEPVQAWRKLKKGKTKQSLTQ